MPDDIDDDEPRRRPRRRDPGEDDDRPRRRREPEVEATDFLIPTGVSAYSMAACYFGLFSCFIPVLGLLMALIAVPCGVVALRRRKKRASTYGSVTGDIRAVLGIVCGSLTLLGYLVFGVLIAAGSLK
jgi:hypothetical protein